MIDGIDFDGTNLDLRVDPALAPSVMRALAGRTRLDVDVDLLPLPAGPPLSRIAIRLLRWYRQIRPSSIGQRCVWDPSCSRYAELSIRGSGLKAGLAATISRLRRCRPGRGGVDIP